MASEIGWQILQIASEMTDEPGTVKGKYLICDNVLEFMHCQMNYCPRNTLLSVIQKFYKPETIVKACDIWFDRVPVKEGETRSVKHRKYKEFFQGTHNIFRGFPTEDSLVFLALE